MALQRGSHQELVSRVAEAVQADLLRFGGAAHLLATFDTGRAVVMAESGDVYSVKFSVAKDGNIELGPQELMDANGVTEKTLRKFVRAEAKAAVDLFLQGLTDRANEKIARLLPLVDYSMSLSDTEVVEDFAESREVPRLWKATVEARKPAIVASLDEGVLPPALQPQFADLYERRLPAEELGGKRPQVVGQVQELLLRLMAVEEQADMALNALSAVRPTAMAEGGAESYKQLEDYARDLRADVNSVKTFVEEALSDFKGVELLARVFDAVAGEISSFEVAGAFAAKMTSRLAEANR